VLFVDNPGVIHVDGEPRQRLSEVLPKLSNPRNLGEDIARALENFPEEQVAEIAHDILSYPDSFVCKRTIHEVIDWLSTS